MSETFRAQGSERRRAARAPIAIPVALTLGDRAYTGELVNLSETGAFVRAAADVPAGTPATVQFTFDSADARTRHYVGQGQVVRTADGFGIHLTTMTRDLRGFARALTGTKA